MQESQPSDGLQTAGLYIINIYMVLHLNSYKLYTLE